MGTPPVLILNEPTNELDPLKRHAGWSYLSELQHVRGVTVVLVTHNLLEAERVVERIAIIDQGRLQALGTPGELKRRVSGTVRLEVQRRDNVDDRVRQRLNGFAGSVRAGPGRWRIVASRDDAPRLLQPIIDLVGMDSLDDFRLITPTIEDVYVRLTGRQWDDAGRNTV